MNTYKNKQSVNNGCQQKGFFAAHGLCAANQPKPRAAKCCPTSFAPGRCFDNYCYALPALKATLFYLISPEAVLLTGKVSSLVVLLNEPKTKRARD
jgi:hypothetical protein